MMAIKPIIVYLKNNNNYNCSNKTNNSYLRVGLKKLLPQLIYTTYTFYNLMKRIIEESNILKNS